MTYRSIQCNYLKKSGEFLYFDKDYESTTALINQVHIKKPAEAGF